ncbi:MAG: hypothetical protein V4679_16735 [Pseudomonadota bacterium]
MNYKDFIMEAIRLDLRPPPSPLQVTYHSSLDNEALFQLPLLAMVILTLSKGKRKPKFAELGQLVGECLERTVVGFKGSSQGIGWSANLRIRTVKALTFLEQAGFVVVDERDGRVSIEEKGRNVIDYIVVEATPLASALSTLERSYENISAERRIESEV